MEHHFIIEPLSALWWKGIFWASIISVGIIQLAIRIPPDKRRMLMILMGVLQLSREVWRQWYLSEIGMWDTSNSLPFHLCGIASILSGIMMLRASQDGFEFLIMLGIPGALHSFLTPELVNGGDTYQIMEYYLSHGGIILIAFYLAIVEGYRIREKSWLTVVILGQFILIFIAMMNQILDANYMYLSQRPIAANPLILGAWPWYILGFEMVGIIHVLIFYAGFRKMKPLPF